MAGYQRTEECQFRVYGQHKSYDEEPAQSKLLAAFRFLLEAIDYLEYATVRCPNEYFVLDSPRGTPQTAYANGKLAGDAGRRTARVVGWSLRKDEVQP